MRRMKLSDIKIKESFANTIPSKEKINECRYNWRMCAWWVKLADMKDHLTHIETLTEELRDKYLAALPYLL